MEGMSLLVVGHKALAVGVFVVSVAADTPPLTVIDSLAKLGIGVVFGYYLFVHAPKQEEKAHHRRMEELKFLAEILSK